MIKNILRACLVAACFVQLPAFATQIIKTVPLNYDEKDFIYQYDVDSCLSIVSFKHNSVFGENISSPALPYIPIHVLIGENQEYVSEKIDAKPQTLLYNVEMAPNPTIMIVGHSMVNREKAKKNFTSDSYPSQNVIYTGTHTVDGYKMLSFMICPYRYEAHQKRLSFLQDFSLKIELKESNSSTTKNKSRRESRMKGVVENLVVNYNEMGELYPATMLQQQLRPNSNSELIDYIIITNENLRPYFQPLADWKTTKGVKAKVFTTDSIYSWYPTMLTNQLKIKSFLRDYHNTYGVYYVLLGGENSIVPSQGCYGQVSIDSCVVEDRNIPTDMFYACIGDLDWDKNHDEKVGDVSDSIDYGQSLCVTRALVKDSTTTKNFVNRIISYEKNPPIEKWTSKILMGGAIDTGNLSEQMGNLVFSRSEMFDKGMTCWRLYNNVNDFNYTTPSCTASHLQEQLSQDYPFVDIITHGDQDYWALQQGYNYSIDEASNMQNNGFPIIITTTACNTNEFDNSEPCLSAVFMQNPNSNIVAYLGCSKENFYLLNPLDTLNTYGISNYFDINYYQTLFNGYRTPYFARFGAVVSHVKDLLRAFNRTETRIVLYGMNPIGDPEMPVFIEKPHTFDTIIAEMDNGVLEISVRDSGTHICAMSLSDNGNSYYKIDYTNGETIRYENAPDSLGVCITKEGHIPLSFHVYNGNIYLQNETYRGNYTLDNMSKVIIGGDVTDKKEQGPVVIEDGRFTFNYTNSVTIKNNFEVKKGAELIIEQE